MTIDIDESLLGLWYVCWRDTDWMAAVHRSAEGPPTGKYRFRYYRDGNAFNSKDEKSWYDLSPMPGATTSESELIAAMSEMAAFLQKQHNGKKWELLRGAGSLQQLIEQLRKLPFAHTKELRPKECTFSMREHGTDVTVTAVHKATGKRATASGPAARKDDVKARALRQLGELLYGSATA